jgi:hypothetical protein
MNTTIHEIAWVVIGTLFTFLVYIATFQLGTAPFILAAPIAVFWGSISMMILQSRSVIHGTFGMTRHWIIPAGIGVGGTISCINISTLGLSAYVMGIVGGAIIISANYLGALFGKILAKDAPRDGE